VVPSEVDSLWLLQPLKSISVAEDRKDDKHQAHPQTGQKRSPGPFEVPASATMQMPFASSSASLPGYVSWLELQYQQAIGQLAAVEAENVPAVYQHCANLPHHSHVCSQYPLGQSLPHDVNTNQVYQSAPAASSNSIATNQAASACQNWSGMSFRLPGSCAEGMGEMEGVVAGLGSIDRSLSSDGLAMLAQQSILEAYGHKFNGCEATERPMLLLKHPL